MESEQAPPIKETKPKRLDCRGDPWIMVIFGWLRQNTPFYYY